MKTLRCFTVITLAAAFSLFAADKPEEKLKPALDAITPDGLLAHVKVLASDEFEGRAPGSKGEDLTVDYVSRAIQSAGSETRKPERHLHAGSAARRNYQ